MFKWKAFFIFYVVFFTSYGQVSRNFSFDFPSASIISSPKYDTLDYQGFTEAKDLRTTHSRTFKNKKGDVRSEFCVKPICFQTTAGLEPILFNPKKNNSNCWSALNQPIGTVMDSLGALTLLFPDKNSIQLSTNSLNGSPYHAQLLEENSNDQYLFFGNNEILKSVRFIEGGFKTSFILQNMPSITGENYIIQELLSLPKGWLLRKEVDALTINNGKIDVAILGDILCFDQENAVFKGVYDFEKIGDDYLVKLVINSAWLQDNRSFPVIIDPVVAGIPSQWSGGNMPSCFMPTYNKDSLLVSIPAGVTLTGLYVSSSFYADPFTPATMGMGSMYFSTSCAGSQYFTITGALANSPGTAYLDSFNLLNPLSCCFSKSCNDTSIYVRFHLGRNSLGTGCNINYLRYDQFTQYPFKVVMYGKTPEPYGNEWYVPQSPICSNICEFTATGYARYGVPPYTFTHPWCQDTVIAGENEGCSVGSKNNVFTLINPNCPIYCEAAFTELPVPPPVIYDACGTQVVNIPFATKPIIPAARPVAVYDSTLCEGTNLNLNLSSCLPGGTITYFGNGLSGQGNINQELSAVNDSITIYDYYSYATLNGCTSDTLLLPVYVIPNPIAAFTISPNPCIVETPFSMISNSSAVLGPIASQSWSIDGSFASSTSGYTSMLSIPGDYTICLSVEDLFGCVDTTCQQLAIIPAAIENINIITPNNDNSNDVLYFDYLDSYEETEIAIYNRWGNLVYQASPYLNDWSGGDVTDGVYYYLLVIKDTQTTYKSFFHIVH